MPSTSRQSLLARDVMTPKPVCADPDMTLRELARLFDAYEISGVPVIDGGGRLVGVVSKSDIVSRLADDQTELRPAALLDIFRAGDDEEDAGELREPALVVGDFMTVELVTATSQEPVARLAKKMTDAHVHRVIVVDAEHKPIGVVTSLDLLKLLAS